MTLHVAPGCDLPDEYVVAKAAILATSGAGKSNAAVVLAEEMHRRKLPWVAVDPKGDWWGMRASADASGPGLPVPILGGLHGDLPLSPNGGKAVARFIAEQRLTCILDVSEFDTLQAMWGFLAEFALELLRVNKHPLHVFAEEASDYLPQSKMEKGNLPKCIGAWRRLVAQGRNRGVGVTLISQRSAKIDKDALDLIETLFAMRATSPRDLAAIRGWVASHDVADELVDSLPGLDDGEAWAWSPHRFHLAKRIVFHRRKTFDSGATPLLAAEATDSYVLAHTQVTVDREAEDPQDWAGIIRARVALLDRKAMNAAVTVFVAVRTAQHNAQWLGRFAKAVASFPEVMDCYRMSGEIDYLIRLALPDIEAYDAFYKRLIAKVDLSDVTSMFAMEEIKSTTRLPLSYLP